MNTAGIAVRHQIEMRSPRALKPALRNARTHDRKQLRQIARSIERFGFTNPVLIDGDDTIIAGHGRVAAALELGMDRVPVVCLADLGPAERRAYMLADNRIALNAGWDPALLALELGELGELGFDLELTGFGLAEIDLTLEQARDAKIDSRDAADDAQPTGSGPAVTAQADLWLLGNHRLVCGDARDAGLYERLLDGGRADVVFTDPPYNVKIDGNVCGLGAVTHREFAFASGELSEAQFIQFLIDTLGNAAQAMRDGAIAFVCMDWRHMGEMLAAGRAVFSELKNLVVWNKTNGGMGTFYRSKHELIFVFKQGSAPHTNSFGLGDTGRYRTNVWDYPGISSMGSARSEELAMHPTVKPVALVADALRDCSRRGEVVLDCFAGSGSTIIAAEKTGRRARAVEYDPLYCDTIIRRWEAYTGRDAIHEASGEPFQQREENAGRRGSDG